MASTVPLHIPRFLSTIGRNRNDGASIKGDSSIVKSPAKRLNRISNSNSRPHPIPPNRTYVNQNKSITILSKNEDLQGLLSFKNDRVVFNEVNWSTLFNKLGRFKGRKDEIVGDERFKVLLEELEEIIEEDGDSWGIQSVSNIFHSLAVLNVHSPPILNYVSTLTPKIIDEGTPQAISNVAYSYAVLGVEDDYYFESINDENVIEGILKKGYVQDISNTVWAGSCLGYGMEKWVEKIGGGEGGEICDLIVEGGRAQEIANTFYSVIQLEQNSQNSIAGKKLAEAIENKGASKLVKFGGGQEIGNVIWSMAQGKLECDGLVKGVAEEAERIVGIAKIMEVRIFDEIF
ncbi:hypothetical protein TrLO_g2684 [Triparma laevis f. longispina]|uniref:Uncharacterized protein n=1 Tax=Triparma laevis f. longispina TaxID=1714387 RepID=A0A9W7DM61_9STRA|nr:hypothetical protein TrLO_g2684 [Triparma laevis f. longispina]